MPFLGAKERLHLNLARLKKQGHNFEIDVDPDLAIEYKQGKDINIRDILKTEQIFSDIQKGNLASEHLLEQIFGTSDTLKVAEIIIKQGNIQLTTEHRKKLIEQKMKKIIDIIHKNTVDPKTHLPHPTQRIEAAIEESKVRIDEFKPIEKQVEEIIKAIRPVLPIKFEKTHLKIIVPSRYATKFYADLHNLGKIINEKWLDNGDLNISIEVPSGIKVDVINRVNALTHGDVKITIVNEG